MRSKHVHVIPHKRRWAAKTRGNSKVGVIFNTQSKAIDSDRKPAIKNSSVLLVHKFNGQMVKNSFRINPSELKA